MSKFQSRWQMSSNSMEDVYLDLQPSPRLCHVSNQAARIAAGMKINYYIDLQTSLRLCHERNNVIKQCQCFHEGDQSKFQSRWQMSSNSMEDVYLNLQPSPRLCHVSNQAARIAAGMKINNYIDLQTSLRLCHERNNVIKQCQFFVQEAGQSKFQSRWQMSSNSMEDVYLNLQPSPRLCHVSNQAARIAAGMKINNYIDLQTSLRLCHERNNVIKQCQFFVQEAGQSKFQSRWQMSSNSMEDVYLNLQPSPRLCHVSNQAARIAAGMKINNYIDLQTSLRLCHERNNVIKQCQCFHEGVVSIPACTNRLMLEMAIRVDFKK
ncbi:AP3D [Mytilus edulis]|uniref:AP3D n=1 Tax=Mytilus edulis TaxID=6550 RepID=A0A8S3SBE0_MYTED|nr:AP3D [Mytilus edulis]